MKLLCTVYLVEVTLERLVDMSFVCGFCTGSTFCGLHIEYLSASVKQEKRVWVIYPQYIADRGNKVSIRVSIFQTFHFLCSKKSSFIVIFIALTFLWLGLVENSKQDFNITKQFSPARNKSCTLLPSNGFFAQVTQTEFQSD